MSNDLQKQNQLQHSIKFQPVIESFLIEHYPARSSRIATITMSENLFESGWLDSILTLKLILHLEKQLSIKITPFEMSRQNFETMEAITRFLSHKIHK